MKRSKLLILGLVLVSTLAATPSHCQETTPGPLEMNPSAIVAGLNPDFWRMLLAVLVCGAVGGLVYELIILQGNVEWPHKLTKGEPVENPLAISKFMIDLGTLARIVIGATAAVAALLVLSPSTAFGLVATALVAGSEGTSIFRSMQDRFLAVVAKKDAIETKNVSRGQDAKIKEAWAAMTALKKKYKG